MLPRLPLDVLYLIVRHAINTASTPREWADAPAVSLVCRDLRDVGQGALWHTLILPHYFVEASFDSPAKKRLLSMVRDLRWDEGPNDDDPFLDEERSARSYAVFLHLLKSMTSLEAVAASCGWRGQLPRLLPALRSSPSRLRIRRLALVGEARHGLRSNVEDDVVVVLAQLPALSSLAFNVFGLTPSSTSSTLPSFRLRELSIDTDGNESLPDHFQPGLPRFTLSNAIDPSLLVSVTVGRYVFSSPKSLGWIHWLSRPGFAALRSLEVVHHGGNGCRLFLPILSSCLGFHPTLLHLTLTDTKLRGIQPDSFDGPPIFRDFLLALPPALETLTFGCPVVFDDWVKAQVPLSPAKGLRLIEGTQDVAYPWARIFRLTRNEETGELDEVHFSLSSSALFMLTGLFSR
ncbi:hypothetical protein JCM8097_006274 [Rhodosporidiobolus ruineniae]